MAAKYSHIIWDWNGTLLNDVDRCLHAINILLKRRNLPQLSDTNAYRSVFCFPVIEYYRHVGFDLDNEPFAAIAAEYMELYHGNAMGPIVLYDHVENVLKRIKEAHIIQTVLSASHIDHLLSQIGMFPIAPFFSEILGITDIYAAGKMDIGKAYMNRIQPKKALMIGDTVHDYEVAQALGIDCLLIAQGHQSHATLSACPVPVVSDIQEAIDIIA